MKKKDKSHKTQDDKKEIFFIFYDIFEFLLYTIVLYTIVLVCS